MDSDISTCNKSPLSFNLKIMVKAKKHRTVQQKVLTKHTMRSGAKPVVAPKEVTPAVPV